MIFIESFTLFEPQALFNCCSESSKNLFHSNCFVLLALIMPLNAHSAINASSDQGIVALTSGTKVLEAESVDQHFILLAQDQVGPAKLNQFSSFNMNGKPVTLSHSNTSDPDAQGIVSSGRIIVLEAPSFQLNGEVSLVGSPADLLIVATSNSPNSLVCDACSFSNFGRVSFVTASSGSVVSNSDVQVIKANSAGGISVSNLVAPGLVSLDLVTRHLEVNGSIDLSTRVRESLVSGYEIDLQGNLTAGAGGISVLLGNLTWDYAKQEVVGVHDTTTSFNVSGRYVAPMISFAVAGNLQYSASVVSDMDLLTTTNYLGQVYVPSEQVEVISFGDLTVTESASFKSEGLLRFLADKSLTYQHPTSLTESTLRLVSRGDLKIESDVNVALFKAAGGQTENLSTISANEEIELWAEETLINRNGGKLISNKIRLVSENGIVRNGSRTAFNGVEASTEEIAAMSAAQAGINEDNTTGIEFGTYSSLGDNVVQSTWNESDKTLQVDLTAQILASTVEVEAVAFENINPYFEQALSSGFVFFDPYRMTQVGIYAEHLLKVKAKNYCLNSSAELIVSSVQGKMELDCGVVKNEPYRVENRLSTSLTEQITDGGTTYEPTQTQTESLTVASTLAFLSPPGVIRSFGDFATKAPRGFVTNMSFVEVFGDATFDVNAINVIGLENTVIVANDSTTSKYRRYRSWCSGKQRAEGRCERVWRQYLQSTSTDILISESEDIELDTLFVVQGNLIANAAAGWFYNNKPLEEFTQTAIDHFVSEVLGVDDRHEYISSRYEEGLPATTAFGLSFPATPGVTYHKYKDTNVASAESLLNSGQLSVETEVYEAYTAYGYPGEHQKSFSQTLYSIFVIFKEYVENALEYISEAWDSLWN